MNAQKIAGAGLAGVAESAVFSNPSTAELAVPPYGVQQVQQGASNRVQPNAQIFASTGDRLIGQAASGRAIIVQRLQVEGSAAAHFRIGRLGCERAWSPSATTRYATDLLRRVLLERGVRIDVTDLRHDEDLAKRRAKIQDALAYAGKQMAEVCPDLQPVLANLRVSCDGGKVVATIPYAAGFLIVDDPDFFRFCSASVPPLSADREA